MKNQTVSTNSVSVKLLVEKQFSQLPYICRFWGRPKAGNKNKAFQLSVKHGDRARVEDTAQIYFPDPEDTVLVEQHVSHTFKIKILKPSADVQAQSTMASATKTQKQTSAATTTKAAPKKAAAKRGDGAPAKAAPAPAKAAPKKAAAKAAPAKAEGGPGKIEQIIALHKKGLSNKEIAEQGFNKTTISIQVAKFKKEKAAAKPAKK